MTGLDSAGGGRGELQARLLWFRTDHPDAEIETELVVAEDDMAVCRATLRTSSAGGASGHGGALRDSDGATYVEVAEDRALSRALTALGYGSAQAETSEGDEPHTIPSPPIDLVSARSLLREEQETPDTDDQDEQPAAPQPLRQEQSESETDDEASGESRPADGADVNWNKFWAWARPRGYSNARELSELLGVEVLAHTPREVRQMLVKYEMDNPPGGDEG